MGFVYNFAGNFDPGYSLVARGQLLPINQNQALFSLYGTTYGGNGVTTFALPDLTGRATVGTGTGPGLPNEILGHVSGSATVSLTTAQLPSHNHTLSTATGGVTDSTGGNQPFSNTQPSLSMNRVIAVSGEFPGGGGPAFLGQVATFAGNFAPGGWMLAQGQLLSIASNTALFSILGTTYGGDGRTTFALPDLRGRVSVGADSLHQLGSTFGQQSTTLTTAQLVAHLHSTSDVDTGVTGSALSVVNNYQPSLALNYLVALNGIFPSNDSGPGFTDVAPILGQIVEYAGSYIPDGWALAQGQLLSINQNQALFALLGTMYGGDGVTTLRCRICGGVR